MIEHSGEVGASAGFKTVVWGAGRMALEVYPLGCGLPPFGPEPSHDIPRATAHHNLSTTSKPMSAPIATPRKHPQLCGNNTSSTLKLVSAGFLAWGIRRGLTGHWRKGFLR